MRPTRRMVGNTRVAHAATLVATLLAASAGRSAEPPIGDLLTRDDALIEPADRSRRLESAAAVTDGDPSTAVELAARGGDEIDLAIDRDRRAGLRPDLRLRQRGLLRLGAAQPLPFGEPPPVAPAGCSQRRPGRLGRRPVGLAVDRVVTSLAQVEGQLAAVVGMLEEAAEVADLRVGRLVDAHEHDRPKDVLAADLKADHRRRGDGRRHPGDRVTGDPPDLAHVPLGILEAGIGMGGEDDVGEDPVDPVLHLVREPRHHRVDDDHRGHAERDADHARQRDPTGAEVTPAEQELVHGGR